MPYAQILTTASKANLAGGAFADSLTANVGDSLAFPQFNGRARVTHAWAIDSDSVAEGEILLTRYESVHDQQHGLRFEVPALTPGGAATVAAHSVIKPPFQVEVFSGDTMTVSVTGTAADDFVFSYL